LTEPRIQPKRCPTCGHVLGARQKPLTKIEAALLRVICTRIASQGCAPTFEELGKTFRWKSIGTVAEHIMNLELKGYIKREPRNARAITVLVSFDEIGTLPVETKHD